MTMVKDASDVEDAIRYYILDENKMAVPTDLKSSAKFTDNPSNKRVALDVFHRQKKNSVGLGETRISTVFLGIDQGFGDNTEPILFETMVFAYDDDGDHDMERCSTWEQAQEMHKGFVDKYKEANHE